MNDYLDLVELSELVAESSRSKGEEVLWSNRSTVDVSSIGPTALGFNPESSLQRARRKGFSAAKCPRPPAASPPVSCARYEFESQTCYLLLGRCP